MNSGEGCDGIDPEKWAGRRERFGFVFRFGPPGPGPHRLASAVRPDAVLADEPTGALDQDTGAEVHSPAREVPGPRVRSLERSGAAGGRCCAVMR
ncbi:hypothetical protein ACWCPI_35480 [Streptomyces sp. NPDC001920]